MSAAGYAHCGDLVRREARGAWLESLFAPAALRPHLWALQAFALEIAQVRDKTTTPLAGEIRLQYWRDVLAGQGRGDSAGNPVASALMLTVAERRLPVSALDAMAEARIFDLYDDPMPDLPALEAYCGATSGALIRLMSLALADGGDPGGAAACGHAGMALGIVRILRRLPRGHIFLPLDLLGKYGAGLEDITAAKGRPPLAELRALALSHLAAAQAGLRGVAPPARAAFLALAQVEADLKRFGSRGDSLAPKAEEAPLMRQWRLWRYARRWR